MSDDENKLYGEILAELATQDSDGEAASRYLIEAMKVKYGGNDLPLRFQFFFFARDICEEFLGKDESHELAKKHAEQHEDKPWPPSCR